MPVIGFTSFPTTFLARTGVIALSVYVAAHVVNDVYRGGKKAYGWSKSKYQQRKQEVKDAAKEGAKEGAAAGAHA